MVHIKDIQKRYLTLDGIITALDGVSLEIEDGDFVAIVGKSGSGKTTLLNMIGGLDIPDAGCVFIDNVNITKLSTRKQAILRRRKIGIIYQFYNLIPELNVKENITLPTELDCGEIDSAWLKEILKSVGIEGREQAYPEHLSGGQQQRVAVARAIFNRPSLILADEPTGNLDGENSREIIALLKEMNEKYRITVIVVTHSDEVANSANRIIRLMDGKVEQDRRISNVANN